MTLRELKPHECRRFLGEYEDSVFTVLECDLNDPKKYLVVYTDVYETWKVSELLTKQELESTYNIKLDDRTGVQDPSTVVPVQQEESQLRGSGAGS